MSNCKCSCLISIVAKCNDLCAIDINNKEVYEGYVPHDLNIGGGDYIRIKYCADCGKLQGKWPLDLSSYLTPIED